MAADAGAGERAVREHGGQVGGDRCGQRVERVGSGPERGHRPLDGSLRVGGTDPERLQHELVLGAEVVEERPGLDACPLGHGGDER